MKALCAIVAFATITVLLIGDGPALFMIIVGCACLAWFYACDWSELKPDRRRVDEPVVRERRRRDYETGR